MARAIVFVLGNKDFTNAKNETLVLMMEDNKQNFQDKSQKEREGFRTRNLQWFQDQFPGLYGRLKSHETISELVDEGDGWFNIKFSDQLLYRPSAQEHVEKQLKDFQNNPHRLLMYPPQPEGFDRYAANCLHSVVERVHDEQIEFSAYIQHHKSYYLIVFGLGLGAHLEKLVEETNCQCLVIVEPNLEFIVQSLDVFDWNKLHDTIEKRGGRFDVVPFDDTDVIFQRIKSNIRETNPCSFDGTIVFTHYGNDVFARVDERIKKDANLILSGLGFYFDETVMIVNTHENLRSGNARMIRFTAKVLRKYPAFIIASGPSLDKDIEWIRENQDKAVIFSCGSALLPLLRSGIQPDFQVELENIPELYDLLLDTVKYVDVSKVHLLTSTTIDSRVSSLFDETSYYFRPALSSYPIFARPEDEPMHNGSPTVTNAALALAQNFGFRELYFFGADMGSKIAGLAHSKMAWQNTDEGCEVDIKFNLPVRGNFGGTVYTYADMNWTRDELELAIQHFYRGRFYYNCSDGAYIKGTTAKHSRSIKLKALTMEKAVEIKKIVDGFAPYSREAFNAHWTDEHMRENFSDYCNRLIACFDDPDDVASKRALTDSNKILVAYNHTGLELGLAMTFRGSIWQALLATEYYITRVDGEEERTLSDKIFKEEIVRLIKHLRDLAVDDLGHLSEHKWSPRERILDVERENWD